ncbi:MAG: peptide deformylase, partial [Candidatus Eremiobacteraeota bacterium]|nr:peptide deformylase [Candidatus Eremiobacteraeota bacterium]
QLIDDMFETMYDAPGVGLAAPQVNVSKRLFVMDVHDDEHEPAVVINPKIESAEEEVELTEGCLSVPGMVGEIVRYKRMIVSGLDRDGKKIRLEGEGLFAQCLQHEIDHLDGVLYVDKARNVREAVTEEEKEIVETASE